MAQEPVRYHLPPLALSMETVENFDAWFARAKPGALFVFARGPWLDRQSAIVRHVAGLIAAGRVLEHNRGAGAQREYLVSKRAAAHAVPGAVSAIVSSALLIHPETVSGKVYALLVHAAEAGDPCPTNREIALALALHDEQAAGYRVRELAKGGHISIENRGPRLTRIVTIAATGQRSSDSLVQVGVGFQTMRGRR